MTMRYKRLGDSGLEVSPLCIGTMMFGDRTEANESRRIVDDAYADATLTALAPSVSPVGDEKSLAALSDHSGLATPDVTSEMATGTPWL